MSKTIHIKRFDNGRSTPQEMHKELAFPPNSKCKGCGRPPAIRVIVLAPAKDALERGMVPRNIPREALQAITVPILANPTDRHGTPFLRVSVTYCCKACQPAMERVLAKSVPSWCVVEINEGPNPTERIIVGVT